MEFLDGLPLVAYEWLVQKVKKIPRRGFLADWGYAVPLDTTAALPIGATIRALTQPDLSVDASQHQPSMAPLTSLSTPGETPPTSPVVMPTLMNVASGSGENMVPVQCLISAPKGSGNIHFIAVSDLKYTDDITLLMGGAPLLDQY